MDLSTYLADNRPVILFLYGLVFFVLGLAIFLQARQRSRLQFARDLRWLALFGIFHGLHEWGLLFIPIQAAYLPPLAIDALLIGQLALLALSFVFLLIFGYALLRDRYPWLRWVVVVLVAVWVVVVTALALPAADLVTWVALATIWARYLLAFPGSALAAYGLYVIAPDIAVIGGRRFYNMLRLAGFSLAAYAVFGGLIVAYAPFFPANTINSAALEAWIGLPVELFRSTAGLVLTISIIRALEIFEIETDKLIETMEVEALRAAERERIGQEIHDGAMQGVYAVALILDSAARHIPDPSVAAERLAQAQSANQQVIQDLRRYMLSLRTALPERPLAEELAVLLDDPLFSSLVDAELVVSAAPQMSPLVAGHLLGIVREALANTVRHSGASRVTVTLADTEGGPALTIADNGRGFDPAEVLRGYGLRTIEEHALLIGTAAEIVSAPGKGTTITVPLAALGT